MGRREGDAGSVLVLVLRECDGDGAAQVEGHDLQAQSTDSDARSVQQVADQTIHSGRLLDRPLDRAAGPGRIAVDVAERELRLAEDRGQRSPQLVDRGAEEIRRSPCRRGLATDRREHRDGVCGGGPRSARWVGMRRLNGVFEGGQELDDQERLVHHSGEARGRAACGGPAACLGHRRFVRGEHEDREVGVRGPDGGGVSP